MRIGKIGWAVALAAVALMAQLAGLLWSRTTEVAATAITSSTEDRSVFFRLIAKYRHGEEAVDFDIVVGCAVKVTGYGYGGSSYDAFRDPIFFVKETTDGAAVMQIVPNACEGQTTENGKVPPDFLPGVIRFDDASDLSLGIAYVSEDAFENERSKLTFLGSSIHKATRAEWEAFQPTAGRNLMDQRPFIFGTPEPTAAEIAQGLWDKRNLRKWLRTLGCYGVARYPVTDPALKTLLQRHWPREKPRFWAPTLDNYKDLADAAYRASISGLPSDRYMRVYDQAGFATRARGGQFYSGKERSQLPSKIYPLRAEDGVPWMVPALREAATIYRDVDLMGGVNAGFAYCYASLHRVVIPLKELLVPNYFKRQFVTRVDGVPVAQREPTGPSPAERLHLFFEKDEYFYLEFHFGLS